jgi:hypothetical protein
MIKIKKLHLSVFLICCNLVVVSQTNTFTFNINGAIPPGFENCLHTAGLKWSQHLKIDVPIKVNVFVVESVLLPFSGITFANGRQNFPNAPHSNFMYVTALANQIAGVEINPGESDMDIYFNISTYFYYGTGKPNSSQLDFISTAMHEIGHGLGFYSAGYVNASGIGAFGNIPASAIAPASTSFPWRGQDGAPTIYDKYLVLKSQSSLVECAAQNSKALGDSIKNGPIYFSGPMYANSLNLNSPIEVEWVPGQFFLGEDLLHLNSSFDSTIMSYGWGPGDTVRVPTTTELLILKEIGWNLTQPVGLMNLEIKKNTIELSPNPASTAISLKGAGIKAVRIYNGCGELIKTEYNPSGHVPFQLSISNFEPGVYLAEIIGENEITTTIKRFIRE